MEDQVTTARKPVALIVAIVIIVLVAAGYGVWRLWFSETVETLEGGEELVMARDGRQVSGFPNELVFEPEADIDNSYAIEYTDARQPVLNYSSNLNFSENVELIGSALIDGGWNITRLGDSSENPATFFYAKRGDEQVSVVVSLTEDARVEVSVTYLAR